MIMARLRETGPMTASQLADELDMTHQEAVNGVRYLHMHGLIEVRSKNPYSGTATWGLK